MSVVEEMACCLNNGAVLALRRERIGAKVINDIPQRFFR